MYPHYRVSGLPTDSEEPIKDAERAYPPFRRVSNIPGFKLDSSK